MTTVVWDDLYMRRSFDLARMGRGNTSPNPLVGAIIIKENQITAEGYHEKLGQAHAEVNAIKSLPESQTYDLSRHTLYCSLEPCNHFGKTPPCSDLIIDKGFRNVKISCLDPSPGINGKSIEKMEANDILVTSGILAEQGAELIRDFTVNIRENRPFIRLKFAVSRDGFLGFEGRRTSISSKYTQYLVHKWRSHHDAILAGTNTVVIDNPHLTNRLYWGKSPIRIVIDQNQRIPAEHHVFDGSQRTILFTSSVRKDLDDEIEQIPTETPNLYLILEELHRRRITSLFVEGGSVMIKSFVDLGLWDEAIVINSQKNLGQGIKAPELDVPSSAMARFGPDIITLHHKNA